MKLSALVTGAFAGLAAAHPTVHGTSKQPQLSKRTTNATKQAALDVTDENNGLKTSFGKPYAVFQPKVFVVNMFELEETPWLELLDFAHNITIPGLLPVYPDVHCTTNYSVCQMSTGEGEINAAASVAALALNPLFDLSKTYFLISGIAGGEPNYTTIGGVTFAKYSVQVALEYQMAELEVKQLGKNWTTGYFAYGTDDPYTYPGNVYGTEVFELNSALRDRAVELALSAELLNGTKENEAFRKLYKEKAARALPTVSKCDVLTSDTYFTGNILGDYFSNFTKLMTNGSAEYCATAQEDNASLEVFTRMDLAGLLDYLRVVVMRTISDFARPPPSLANDTVKFFTNASQGGIEASLDNLVRAGLPFVHDVLKNWKSVYANGLKYAPTSYVGDIFGTMGGTPTFGKTSFDIA